jgi:hypothetical protein
MASRIWVPASPRAACGALGRVIEESSVARWPKAAGMAAAVEQLREEFELEEPLVVTWMLERGEKLIRPFRPVEATAAVTWRLKTLRLRARGR